MGDNTDFLTTPAIESPEDVARFADSYASFNRVINTLQRKYIELKDEFTAQNERLVETNRKLIEMTSRNLAATELLDSILMSMSAGVVAVNREGIITHFNPSASLLLGIPSGEPLGKHYRDVIPPGDPIDANALRAAESGRAVDEIEKRLDLADGTRLIVSVSTAILRDKQNRPAGAMEVFHDLTKTKKMEQEIARLNTLAALGEMAAAVAHQVRNPLSGILGYGSLLRRDMDSDDPRQKLITKITDGVEALNNTVTTLLNYTRHEEVNRELVCVRDYLAESLIQFRRENAELAADMEFCLRPGEGSSADDTELRLDPVLFGQVLFNLYANGCEACRARGRIEITYRKLPRQVAAERFGGQLLFGLDETVFEVRVADSGPGVSPEELQSIFAPFFTTKEGGNGLGLAVAQKIVRAHGGEMTVDVSGTSGAHFVIALPVRIGQAEVTHSDGVRA